MPTRICLMPSVVDARTSMDKVKIYYNSACPVCKAGIEDQQCRMAAQGMIDTEWIDVHSNPESVKDVGADLEFVRERLHVRAADGYVHVGAEAIRTLFESTRGQRWLSKLMGLPVIRYLSEMAYNEFARRLYRWNRKRGRW